MAFTAPFYLCVLLIAGVNCAGILYPRPSAVRQVLPLDGLWNFNLTDTTFPIKTHEEEWYLRLPDLDKRTMPVPSSYNDLGPEASLRDHVGTAWYLRDFFVPKSWEGERVWLRFSSVCQAAEVWVNGKWVLSHDLGHLPFQADVTSIVKFGGKNVITVAVINTLSPTTIPQGELQELISGRIKQTYTFDFFNYAGIDRPVVLYTTPSTYIDDITVSSTIDGTSGSLNYSIGVEGSDAVTARISLLDKKGIEVANGNTLQGTLSVKNAQFWWPYLMDPEPGYLYSLRVELLDKSGAVSDQYALPVGIRTLSWDSTSLKINGKNVYLRGFGRHEDSDIRGKGLDLPLIIRDHNLIKWVGANAYRTSHYPYAEEILDMADQLGIMIIAESPAVNTEKFTNKLLENHKKSLTELIKRDKNRASVIMWSAANEPRTKDNASDAYYKEVIGHIKGLDRSRPVTVVNIELPDVEHSGQYLDIASFNIYTGWYSYAGDEDVITSDVLATARKWHQIHKIPVMVTEYGADTQEGLHYLPAYVWSEEYQDEFLAKYFEAFDQLRKEGFFIGEMIWNFADFKTAQAFLRVGGNKKGIFTRNRQPKASAHLLRRRYWDLANILDKVTVPDDVDNYVSSRIKDEL